MQRKAFLVLTIAISLIVGAALPVLLSKWRGSRSLPNQTSAPAPSNSLITLSPEQIRVAKIEIAPVKSGVLLRRLLVPATLKPDPDHLARVAAKVSGVVAEMRVRLGADVQRDETIALIESREVADAKSEFLAASVNHDLQEQLFQREKGLYEKKIIAEQTFLRAKTLYADATVKFDLARQKLAALDLSETEISDLAQQPINRLQQKAIRAPIAGRVIERLVNIGQPVNPESQIYVLADLSVLEADLAAPISDLATIRQGQAVTLKLPNGSMVSGVISAISSLITPETRTGHVLASFKNPDLSLNPGNVLTAEIALTQTPVNILIPRTALQLIHNQPTVFVRVGEGFEERQIEIGASDENAIEVREGLKLGENIVIANSFVLKAEAGKNEMQQGE